MSIDRTKPDWNLVDRTLSCEMGSPGFQFLLAETFLYFAFANHWIKYRCSNCCSDIDLSSLTFFLELLIVTLS